MEFTIDLIAERSVLRESIKGIIWTIFFNRLFGPTVPSTNEFLSITYPLATNLPDLESLIEEKITVFIRTIIDKKQLPIKGVISIQFSNKSSNSKRKSSGWFGRDYESDDSKIWETWTINIECLPIKEGVSTTTTTSATNSSEYSQGVELSMKSFECNLLKIYDIVDREKEHIPPITSLETSPFPYSINISEYGKKLTPEKSNSDSDEGWGTYIKKILD
ncbi:uncharacterized protein KGF55_004464 [Candida pseudojiufengensis]|uniref:uncharacterized protein n=1 Tax=Candida pseudojiufengensis TaxID=497109 RepID=UPI00222593C5|nr:uncharacterized protein KGF55_004464 [Candida pseudojiufengensis]KAI5960571.1 hypothetical protein KGF55_004464 [Candida pseudojiufengensis]